MSLWFKVAANTTISMSFSIGIVSVPSVGICDNLSAILSLIPARCMTLSSNSDGRRCYLANLTVASTRLSILFRESLCVRIVARSSSRYSSSVNTDYTTLKYSRLVVLYASSGLVRDRDPYSICLAVLFCCFCSITHPTRTSLASAPSVK